MTSSYQHLDVAELIWDTYGPLASPFDAWRRHDVFRFEGVRIGQEGPVIRLDEAGARELAMLRWGLVPPWFKGDAAGAKKFQSRTFNARGETAHEKGSFKAAWKKRRCLVPALGFYEFVKPPGWKKGDSKTRLLVRPVGGGVVSFAGLWSRWRGDDPPWETYTIVTCPPNEEIGELHHRMPLVIEPEHWDAWLDPATSEEVLAGLVKPARDGVFEVVEAPRKGSKGPGEEG